MAASIQKSLTAKGEAKILATILRQPLSMREKEEVLCIPS
jgi:hypothetical protein